MDEFQKKFKGILEKVILINNLNLEFQYKYFWHKWIRKN